ncbi:MAG: Arc family DNA-binding protein [Lachnospiraceae bacterium]|nr:Arc family DNA-binding protein [Lachnospiraceae bacterium]
MQPNNEFNQIAYQNNYIKEKYDRINLTVPKGKKEKIKKKAAAAGKSVNEYINSLIDKDMN